MKLKTHETHINGSPREFIKEILNGSRLSSIGHNRPCEGTLTVGGKYSKISPKHTFSKNNKIIFDNQL
jgi:hypothetical protein